MEIRILVIRTSNPERLADFYRLLGMNFEYHKHGNSPFHFRYLPKPYACIIHLFSAN